MNTILINLEGSITCAFLLITLICACPSEQIRLHQRGSLFLMIAIWCVAFYFAEKAAAALPWDGLTVYSIIMLILALVFTLLFQEGIFSARLAVIMTYLYSIITVKVTMLNFIGAYGFGQSGILSLTIRNYVIYYLILTAVSVFIIRHTVINSDILPVRYLVILILYPALMLLYILLNVSIQYASGFFSSILKISYVIFLALSLLVYYLFYTMFQTYETLREQNQINQRQRIELEGMHRSEAMIRELRKEKHELRNNYFYINSLVKDGKYKELETYLDENVHYRFSTMEEFHTGHSLLDMLLTQKVAEAREKGIHVMTNILLPSSFVIGNDNDMCSLLLNLLNNAIDAEAAEEEKDLQISITTIKTSLNIVIRNRCSTDVLRENRQLATTKQDKENHGIGLKIVRRIAKKHDGIINFHMQDGYFTAEVMLQE